VARTLLLNRSEVEALLDPAALIPTLRSAFVDCRRLPRRCLRQGEALQGLDLRPGLPDPLAAAGRHAHPARREGDV